MSANLQKNICQSRIDIVKKILTKKGHILYVSDANSRYLKEQIESNCLNFEYKEIEVFFLNNLISEVDTREQGFFTKMFYKICQNQW